MLKHPKSTSIIININPKMIILGIAEQKRKKWPPLKGGPRPLQQQQTLRTQMMMMKMKRNIIGWLAE